MWNVIFLVSGLLFWIVLVCIYYSKKSIKSVENRIFKTVVFFNGLEYLFELTLQIYVRLNGVESALVDILSKCYLISIFLVFTAFSLYTCYVCLQRDMEKSKIWNYSFLKVFHIAYGIATSIILSVLPFSKYFQESRMYVYGTAVDFLKLSLGIYMIAWIVLLVKNLKEITSKKYIPMFVVIIFLVVSVFLQSYDPSILIATVVGTLTCYTMYFTIENPDIKMLNELYKNKELMEQNYEDKYNFLFEMTQEARKPLININNLSNELRMEDDPKKIKEGLLTMNGLVRQLDFSINNILNISSLDIQKVKVVNNKYDLEKICQDLEVRIRNEISDNVKFNLTMPRRIPTLLGDYMKIRQILYSILMNACQNTETGSINMKVNLIEKYDVARVIFNISDTGRGMPIDLINEILSTNGSMEPDEINNLEKKEFNLKVCQKVIKIMGGNLMIKSNVGEGTEVILTIDQGVYHEEDNNELEQYEKAVSYRKVLIVSQNKDKLNIIKKKLSDNNITYSSLYYGMDAIDRIKSGKKYEFILVEDDMKEMSGLMTLKGMQELDDFNMPVIVMLNEDKEHIKEHYLSDGFSDYIILDNLDNELDRIIEKY